MSAPIEIQKARRALFHSLANKPQKKPVPTEKEIIYRDSLVYRDEIIEKAVPVERELTWWQQTQMRGFFGLCWQSL